MGCGPKKGRTTPMADEPRSSTGKMEPSFHAVGSLDAFRLEGDGPVDISDFPGRLIALEGTDGVGRSTHIALLREFLETQGFGVMHTGLSRSRLAGDGVRKAKRGTTAAYIEAGSCRDP